MWAAWMPRSFRPEILNQRHDDWPWLLSKIPRSWNAWVSDVRPIKLIGTERERDNIDIPELGKWVIAWPGGTLFFLSCFLLGLSFALFSWFGLLFAILPSYIAFTTKNGLHFRFGTRYDFVDHYYTFPSATLKRFLDK